MEKPSHHLQLWSNLDSVPVSANQTRLDHDNGQLHATFIHGIGSTFPWGSMITTTHFRAARAWLYHSAFFILPPSCFIKSIRQTVLGPSVPSEINFKKPPAVNKLGQRIQKQLWLLGQKPGFCRWLRYAIYFARLLKLCVDIPTVVIHTLSVEIWTAFELGVGWKNSSK
jgi:hypothetical protein